MQHLRESAFLLPLKDLVLNLKKCLYKLHLIHPRNYPQLQLRVLIQLHRGPPPLFYLQTVKVGIHIIESPIIRMINYSLQQRIASLRINGIASQRINLLLRIASLRINLLLRIASLRINLLLRIASLRINLLLKSGNGKTKLCCYVVVNDFLFINIFCDNIQDI